jgi:demethylmenaquinone methyltransferase/2-methoxy-6-polyprenyl-1,4-benzoquinol methylase
MTATPPPSRPARLGDLDVAAHLADPARKQSFVTPMFDIIAPRYDAFTRLFSFGMDAGWKQEALAAVQQVVARDGVPVRAALDLASGTGDVACALARAWPSARVTALDASPRMIDAARARLLAHDRDVADRVEPVVGDMMALPQASATMDVVTASYGIRNVPDAEASVREIARVLRPGGVLATIDFYRPAATWWRVLFLWYLRTAGNVVGWLWHRDPIVYGYIAHSIDAFMSDTAFAALLERCGLEVVSRRRYLLGGVVRHVARKRV